MGGWMQKEAQLLSGYIDHDDGVNEHTLRHVGGLDVSFDATDPTRALGTLVVLAFPEPKVVYEVTKTFTVSEPYIPGFQAVREAGPMLALFSELHHAGLDVQVVLVDGNGIYHPRRCGSATYFGIMANVPTIGVSKTLFQMEGISHASLRGHALPCVLKGHNGQELGVALCACPHTSNPIFVSQGHRVSLSTAVDIVQKCCLFRIPEPIRQADLRSRAALQA
jgi:deoxyinosine 3'endonuclease (endonuclease V)